MATDLDQVWKALSDPTRRSILDLLRKGPKTTTEIVDAFPDMTRHAVMKHIDVLRDCGLVITREDGRRRINTLNPVPIRQIYESRVARRDRGPSGGVAQVPNGTMRSAPVLRLVQM
jgi:DNA-binding transcriptional ArsR family regulator